MTSSDDMTNRSSAGDSNTGDSSTGDSSAEDRASVDSALHLAGGIGSEERAAIVAILSPLDARLRSFRADDVELRLSVKKRSTLTQTMTLEALIARHRRIVTTSTQARFEEALGEVRDDLIRRIGDLKNRSEARNNRGLRRTIRR